MKIWLQEPRSTLNLFLLCNLSLTDIVLIKGVISDNGRHFCFCNHKFISREIDRILGSCGEDGVRVWDILTGRQMFHVGQAGGLCLGFLPDGSGLIVGFADGCLRFYTPETGRNIFTVQGVHANGVTAIAFTGIGLITGGADGQIRTWRMNKYCNRYGKPELIATTKEHKAAVTNVEVTRHYDHCVSGSEDGSCIIWSCDR